MSKANPDSSSKKPAMSHLAVPSVTGCSSFSKTRRKSNSNGSAFTGNAFKRDSVETISTVNISMENTNVDAINVSEEPPPWSSLLMFGIDDPHRMSFTQSLAFTTSQSSSIRQKDTTKYLGEHIALQRRLNNYAKIITIIVLALCFAFVFSYIYKNIALND